MVSSEADTDVVLLEYRSTDYDNTYWQPGYLEDDRNVGREYKHEWRGYLAKKNLEQISRSLVVNKRSLRFSFYSKVIGKKVFDICKMLKQPPEVRYLALEILDRFMVKHFFGVARTIKENGNWTQKLWKIVMNRMVNQSFLRVLSSIQLASKYCRNFRALSTLEIQRLLVTSGQKYCSSRHDLVKSEARIYQTLKCTIPTVTPLNYVEMFFEDFCNEEFKKYMNLTLSSFLNICVDILDIVIIFHREVYNSFYTTITGRPYVVLSDSRFLSVEADYMYLAACVIYTAAILQDPTHIVPEELLKFFASVTQYKQYEIESLGSVILEVVLNK